MLIQSVIWALLPLKKEEDRGAQKSLGQERAEKSKKADIQFC